MKKSSILISITIVLLCAAVASGQEQPAGAGTVTVQKVDSASKVKRVLGEVTSIGQERGPLTVKTSAGEVTVTLDDKTLYRRVPPGETTLEKAVSIKLSDISVGDQVLARGLLAESSVLARELILIAHKDIAEKHRHDREEWTKRGITGLVTAIDPEKKEITVRAHSPEGERPLIITTGEKVAFRRYSTESIRYSDSLGSSFAELKVGDQLRALGDRSTDGTHFAGEEVISGTFRTVVGRITSIDPQTSQVVISNNQMKQPLNILVNKDTKLRRLSPEVGQSLIQRFSSSPASNVQPSGSVNLQNTIENLPVVTIAELKPGDAVLVSTTIGKEPTRVTAILFTVGADNIVKIMDQPAGRRKLRVELGLPSGVDP